MHATAILAGAHGVLIRGPSGAGKSTLALTLLQQGARLVADDRVHLSVCHGRVVAAGPAALRGLIELRGRGLLHVAAEHSAVVRLVIDYVAEDALARMPEGEELVATINGVRIARQPLAPRSPLAALTVREALRALSPHCNTGLRHA